MRDNGPTGKYHLSNEKATLEVEVKNGRICSVSPDIKGVVGRFLYELIKYMNKTTPFQIKKLMDIV